MDATEEETLRTQLALRGHKQRIGRELKQRVVEYAERRTGEGERWVEVTRALGVRPAQLWRWRREQKSAAEKATFRRVALSRAPSKGASAVVVQGPSGLRLELDLDGLAQLLKKLSAR